MKTFITNVLTFIGVIAVIVALRGGVEGLADFNTVQASSGQYSEDPDLARSIDEAVEWVEDNIKLSRQCDLYGKCTDREVDTVMHVMADAGQVMVGKQQDGYMFTDLYYLSERNTLVYEMTFDPDTNMVDLWGSELPDIEHEVRTSMRDEACSDNDIKTMMGFGVNIGYWMLDHHGYELPILIQLEDCS